MTRQPHVSRRPERIGWSDILGMVACIVVAAAFVLMWAGQGAATP
jgi:hypothetical protein